MAGSRPRSSRRADVPWGGLASPARPRSLLGGTPVLAFGLQRINVSIHGFPDESCMLRINPFFIIAGRSQSDCGGPCCRSPARRGRSLRQSRTVRSHLRDRWLRCRRSRRQARRSLRRRRGNRSHPFQKPLAVHSMEHAGTSKPRGSHPWPMPWSPQDRTGTCPKPNGCWMGFAPKQGESNSSSWNCSRAGSTRIGANPSLDCRPLGTGTRLEIDNRG